MPLPMATIRRDTDAFAKHGGHAEQVNLNSTGGGAQLRFGRAVAAARPAPKRGAPGGSVRRPVRDSESDGGRQTRDGGSSS